MVEKRVPLAKFIPFVVPEDQDYFIHQYPSAENIKLANDELKKEGKYRNMKLPKSNDDNNYAGQ